jgi:hypothetical protein
MKKLFVLVWICIFSNVYAQNEAEDTLRVWKPSHVVVQMGSHAQPSNFASIRDFRVLAPGATVLQEDFPLPNLHRMGMNTNPFFAMHTYFHPFAQKKTESIRRVQLRAGIFYAANSWLRLYGYDRSEVRIDTLASSATSNVVYLDSIYERNLQIDYRSERIMLDLMAIVPVFSGTRIFPYWGIGLSAGATFNNRTQVSDYERIREVYTEKAIPFQSNDVYTYNFWGHSGNVETFRNKPAFVSAFYIPLGIDLKIGRKHPVLKRISLIAEVRVGIQSIFIPELYAIHKGFMQNAFGFRFN